MDRERGRERGGGKRLSDRQSDIIEGQKKK